MKTQETKPQYDVDIVVIGSGPGGATTACTLSEAGQEVLLLEEGQTFSPEQYSPFSFDEISHKYRNKGLTTLIGNPKILYAEGMALGGGSEINSALYHRIPTEILEKWHTEFELESCNEKNLIPHYEECEKTLSVSCSKIPQPPASKLLYEAAQSINWKSQEVPRCVESRDSSSSLFGGEKKTMSSTFILRALKAGCQLLSETKVIKLAKKRDYWIISAQQNGNKVHIISKTVFLAGGAIQTPLLLLKSGIRKNIGNSLQVHPTLKVLAQFPAKINSASMGVPSHQVKEFSPAFSFGCSISSQPYLALFLNDHSGPSSAGLLKYWEQMAIYYAMIVSEGHGKIRALPFFKDAFVTYHLTSKDMTLLATALEKLCFLLFRAGAQKVYPGLFNAPILSKEGDLKLLPSILHQTQANLMTIHLFSSCPMGENKKRCATNSYGKVHGYEGLYIADASLLCSAPSVNPQGGIMAICLRNANHYLQIMRRSHV